MGCLHKGLIKITAQLGFELGKRQLFLSLCRQPILGQLWSLDRVSCVYLQNGFNYALTLPNSLQSLFEVYAHRNVVA
ncbi:MAG: hypothetical protein AAGK05_09850, partial [Pseudomonadota bacterium]